MKQNRKERSGKGTTNPVHTPPPPQVIDPTNPPVVERKQGDKKKDDKRGDREKLAPKDEL